MPTFRRRILLEALKIFDLSILVFAFALSAVLTLGIGRVSIKDFFSMRVSVGNFALFIGLLILWHNVFSGIGLYGSHRFSSRLSEAWDVVKATSLSSLILTAAALLFRIRMATIPVLVVFFALSTAMLVSSRLVLKFVLTRTRLH